MAPCALVLVPARISKLIRHSIYAHLRHMPNKQAPLHRHPSTAPLPLPSPPAPPQPPDFLTTITKQTRKQADETKQQKVATGKQANHHKENKRNTTSQSNTQNVRMKQPIQYRHKQSSKQTSLLPPSAFACFSPSRAPMDT